MSLRKLLGSALVGLFLFLGVSAGTASAGERCYRDRGRRHSVDDYYRNDSPRYYESDEYYDNDYYRGDRGYYTGGYYTTGTYYRPRPYYGRGYYRSYRRYHHRPRFEIRLGF
jgi:hypothetical protein